MINETLWLFRCCCLITTSCPTLQSHGLQPARLLCPWDSPGKNAGVGCHFLLQGIFLTQGLNPSLLHWQADSLLLSHQGYPLVIYHDLKNLSVSPSNKINLYYAAWQFYNILNIYFFHDWKSNICLIFKVSDTQKD